MHLQTTVRLIPTYKVDDKQREFLEALINSQTIVQGCLSCTHAKWSDKGDVQCLRYGSVPPNWAIAVGCGEYDYLPF